MPYFITDESQDCPNWAVVKEDGEVVACHQTKKSAISQMVAISTEEGIEPGGTYNTNLAERQLPENYRPALEEGVPEGRACGNCFFYDESRVSPEGDKAYCDKWDEFVRGDYYCNAWQSKEEERQEVRTDLGSLNVGDYVKWDTDTDSFMGAVVEVKGQWLRVKLYKDEQGFWIESEDIAVISAAIVTKTTLTENEEMLDQIDDSVELDEQASVEVREVNLTPPAYMRAAARRGLKYHEEGKSGDGLTPTTVREARAMASGNVTADKWVRIAAWIARHMSDLDSPAAKPGNDKFPSAGVVAHLLWGSGATKSAANRAMKYAEGVVARLEDENRALVSVESKEMAKIETRLRMTSLEMRDNGNGMTFTGYAAIWNSPSVPLPFREKIAPGAFTRSLRARNDIKLLWNHDSGQVLGSTRAGTLRLEQTNKGLLATADLPDTQLGRDAAYLIKRGDIDSMSFGFSVPPGGDEWNSDGTERTLNSVRLHEVSIVAFPAYAETAGKTMVRSVSEVAKRAEVDSDALADAMLKLEVGDDLSATDAELLNTVISKLTPQAEDATDEVAEEPVEENDLSQGMLELKKKKLEQLLKRI
jgi:uncharacterized protein